MSDLLKSYMTDIQATLEKELNLIIQSLDAPKQLKEAMHYSLMAGGKRIRPVFLLSTLESLGKDIKLGLPAACAIEMVHTYSLIHDDLPAMDNDDYRRGKLTNHKVFGEAMAILAGDALLTHAFQVICEMAYTDASKLMLLRELSLLAGPAGMVGGQALDIDEQGSKSLEQLYEIHERKTADLLICAVRMGCHLAQASVEQLAQLTLYAKHIGIAFQIQDDILDEVGDETQLGKAVGSDRDNNKATFISLLGIDGARSELEKHVKLCKEALLQSGADQTMLLPLANLMLNRKS